MPIEYLNCSNFNPVETSGTVLFASSSCEIDTPSSTSAAVPVVTYGEAIISVMLFLILMVSIQIAFHIHFKRIKIKN